MEDIEIKRILEKMESTPSAHCWERIESMLPPIAGSATPPSGTGKSLIHLATPAAKMITTAIAVVATTAVVSLVVFAINKRDTPTTPAPEQPTTTAATTTPDDTLHTENTLTLPYPEEIAVVPATPTSTPNKPTSTTTIATLPTKSTIKDTTAKNPSPEEVTTINHTPTTTNVTPSEKANEREHEPTTHKTPASTAPPTRQIETPQDPIISEEQAHALTNTPPIKLTIPNVFTPNGDGVNDHFTIVGIEACEEHRLIIRNRNGQVVFQSTSYQNDWDGYNLPEGTYVYQFAYKIYGIEEVRSGYITLLR